VSCAGCASRRGPPAELTRPEIAGALSERELEVFRLVGRGMSNAEIAAELVISLATVKTHVRHVLQKLRLLPDRVQAVVVAYESGVVGR
jgi:DNA-binding NarL/FixJ family response regulator